MVGARKWPFILRCLVASRSTSGTAIRTRPLGRLLCNRLPGSAYGRVAQTKTPMAYCASSSLKGADLSDLSQTNLNAVARLLNDRSRKTLGWNTPAAAMAEERAAIKSTVALQLGFKQLLSIITSLWLNSLPTTSESITFNLLGNRCQKK
ncbi:MAG: hypothetical protein ACI9ND_001396 [Yoonia sp.]|jgi:hypothetical protein